MLHVDMLRCINTTSRSFRWAEVVWININPYLRKTKMHGTSSRLTNIDQIYKNINLLKKDRSHSARIFVTSPIILAAMATITPRRLSEIKCAYIEPCDTLSGILEKITDIPKAEWTSRRRAHYNDAGYCPLDTKLKNFYQKEKEKELEFIASKVCANEFTTTIIFRKYDKNNMIKLVHLRPTLSHESNRVLEIQ